MHAESIGIFWITVCSINLYPYCLVKETMQHRKYIFMFLFTLRQSGILLLRIDPNANVSAVTSNETIFWSIKKKRYPSLNYSQHIFLVTRSFNSYLSNFNNKKKKKKRDIKLSNLPLSRYNKIFKCYVIVTKFKSRQTCTRSRLNNKPYALYISQYFHY